MKVVMDLDARHTETSSKARIHSSCSQVCVLDHYLARVLGLLDAGVKILVCTFG